jgi:hypothetical protein
MAHGSCPECYQYGDLYAHGLCRRCYDRERYHQQRCAHPECTAPPMDREVGVTHCYPHWLEIELRAGRAKLIVLEPPPAPSPEVEAPCKRSASAYICDECHARADKIINGLCRRCYDRERYHSHRKPRRCDDPQCKSHPHDESTSCHAHHIYGELQAGRIEVSFG